MADMADLGQQLWRACIRGERARAKSLLNEGANIEHEGGQWGRTPIVVASEKGHLIVVKVLHGRGANVHVQDNLGANALMMAALKGHADVATFLVTECLL
jgi:ankyrin repeat protein